MCATRHLNYVCDVRNKAFNVCDVCNKAFNYVCDVCNKAFNVCDVCNKAFIKCLVAHITHII